MKRNYFFIALMLVLVSTFFNTCVLETHVEFRLPNDFTGQVIIVYGDKQPRPWQRKVVYEVDTTGVVFSDYSGIYGGVLFSRNISVRYADGREIPVYISHHESYYKRFPEKRKSGLVASIPSFWTCSFNLDTGQHIDLNANGVGHMWVDLVKNHVNHLDTPPEVLKRKLRNPSLLDEFAKRNFVLKN